MKIFKKKKCKICKTKTGTRFCMRKGFDICWEDCNILRVDEQCPNECEYHLQSSEIMQLKGKSDSQMEYIDLLKKQMALWITKPQKIFNDQIPITMAESSEGKEKIEEFLNQFKINPIVPLNYLKERLSLDELKVDSTPKTYEDQALEFMQHLYTNEWEKVTSFMINNEYWQSNKLNDKFVARIAANKVIKKISSFDLISYLIAKVKRYNKLRFCFLKMRQPKLMNYFLNIPTSTFLHPILNIIGDCITHLIKTKQKLNIISYRQ